MYSPSTIISILHQSGTFVTTDEPALIHHNHPKPTVYMSFHFLCCILYGFGQMYNDIYLSLRYPQNIFTALKIHCVHLVILLTQTLAASDLFTVSIVLPFPRYQLVVIREYIAFSAWLPLLSNIHLSCFHVFPWLDNSFPFGTEFYSIVWRYQSYRHLG